MQITIFLFQQDDENYGITKYKLAPEKCFIITYGFELTGPPSNEERIAAKQKLQSTYAISPDEKLLLFNGSLNYTT
ncbi:MAG: hypothetical protein WDM90_23600 [Ferruginibacter sp.]